MKSPAPDETNCPSEWNDAHHHESVVKEPHEEGFMEQFFDEHKVSKLDRTRVMESIQLETARILRERFNEIIHFFHECRVPKLVVMATLATNGPMNMVDIARKCGVSKQAVHKAFRGMEPAFRKYATGFERRRNFKNKS
jgi:DNA-binding phage protein